MEPLRRLLPPAGRILLTLIFLASGFNKVANWTGTADHMAAEGMPLVPLFLAGAIVFEIGGGLSVLLGWRARLGATALVIFLIPTTLIFHDFWTFEDAGERQVQMINFMKNLAILGGLLVVIGLGPGSLSVDAARRARGGGAYAAPGD